MPNPSGPNLDGSEISEMEVEFMMLRDELKQDGFNLFVFGDGRPGFKA